MKDMHKAQKTLIFVGVSSFVSIILMIIPIIINVRKYSDLKIDDLVTKEMIQSIWLVVGYMFISFITTFIVLLTANITNFKNSIWSLLNSLVLLGLGLWPFVLMILNHAIKTNIFGFIVLIFGIIVALVYFYTIIYAMRQIVRRKKKKHETSN